MIFPAQFFVTGTDTDVGKTVVSAILATGLKAGYWKPIQAGEETDTNWMRQVTQLDPSHFYPEAYALKMAASPHKAAKAEGIEIDFKKIVIPSSAQFHLIVEGAGGLMVPLNDTLFVKDLILSLSMPALIVSRSGLGTINHTLMTIQTLVSNHIPILGVVMNGKPDAGNRQAIEKYGKVPVIAEVEPLTMINPASLAEAFHKHFGT